MSLSVKIPPSSLFRPSAGIFTATYNVPVVGKYSFDVPANANVDLMGLNYSSLYLFSIMNFTATVPESAYLENIETIPNVDFKLKQSGAQLFGAGYPLVTYLSNNEIAAFFWTTQEGDTLQATFKGQLGQNASLSAFGSIVAQISCNIFEITDQTFIDSFRGSAAFAAAGSNSAAVPDSMKDRI